MRSADCLILKHVPTVPSFFSFPFTVNYLDTTMPNWLTGRRWHLTWPAFSNILTELVLPALKLAGDSVFDLHSCTILDDFLLDVGCRLPGE